jgi:hypothetical protein
MLLREHPLMSYEGAPSWPPAWFWRDGHKITHPNGEVGTLKQVIPCTLSHPRCFLIMQYCGAEYIGALLLSDPVFCREIYRVLAQSCGETIRNIGDIDLSYMALNGPDLQRP